MSQFGDQSWDLAALGGPPSCRLSPINWTHCPEPFRESFRRAAWLLINTPTPAMLLERPGAYVEWYTAGSIKNVIKDWFWFANRLYEAGFQELSEVTRDDLEAFAKQVQKSSSKRRVIVGRLRSVTRLWAYATSLPPQDALVMPPWEDEPLDDFVPSDEGRSENATPIVHPSTMAPLLYWAQRMLEFADDIDAARKRWQELIDALPERRSPSSRDAARSLVESWAQNGVTTLPAALREVRKVDVRYLAAIHPGIHPINLSLAIQDSDAVFIRDPEAPTPIDSPITAQIDGRPWCQAINKNDLLALSKSLQGAALVVVAYLSGMRPHEVLTLRPGCCARRRDSATTVRYSLQGRKYKGVRKEGSTDPGGAERTWTTIAPVCRAIQTMERFFPETPVIFASAADPTQPLQSEKATDRIASLIETANAICDQLELPASFRIPAEPAGPITLSRFRRTLAWHIRRLPHGNVALAIQYGHLSVRQGEGYAGLTADGFTALMKKEEITALNESIEQARRDLSDGGRVSGPAAKRLIELVSQGQGFDGSYLTEADLRRLVADGGLRIYENSQSYLACMFDPSTAVCRSESRANSSEPKLNKCQPNCPNIARTDRHISGLKGEVSRLRAEARSPLTPTPLALRLGARAESLAAAIDKHRLTAMTLNPQREATA